MGSGSSKSRRFGSDRSSSSSFSSSSAAPPGSICSRSSTSSRRRHKARSLFPSSCLGSSSRACDSDDEEADAEVSIDHDDGQVRAVLPSGISQPESDPNEMAEHYQKLKVEQSNEMAAVPSDSDDLGEWIQASNVNNSTNSIHSLSPGPASSGNSLNLSSRFLSHFSFIPSSVSFRFGRASSLGSGREFTVSPVQTPTVNDSDELQSDISISDSVDGHDNPGNRSVGTRHFSSPIARNHLTNVNGNLWRNHQTSTLSNTPRSFGQHLSRDGHIGNSRARSHTETDNLNARYGDWRSGSREPMDHNVQFSRTLSVGRLRDRVLRRPSFSDLTLSPLQRDAARNDSNEEESRIGTSALPSLGSDYHTYGATSHRNDSLRSRESRLHNVLQNRSNFLERRRRIRSQVRALERLGSRSETISRHERSCILSGRHRPGRCTCHLNGRESNSNNDSGARGSISRIVMLAEALFEVLDEIHQQAVALSSRPSVSSIGSVPAPSEVVESLPVKIYSKTRFQSEEVTQCYICLIEYEEGDSMRILPCHHEFHRSCIDKWLKEIHRVCPLCRGDVCRSG